MMRLVFFVKNLTGWSYQTAEWALIGLAIALVAIPLIIWAVRRRKARKAIQAAKAAAAPLPLNRQFENALLKLVIDSNGDDREFYAAHHLWLLLKKPQSVAALGLANPHEDLAEMLVTFLRLEQEREQRGTGMARAASSLATALDGYNARRTAAQGGKRPAAA